MTNDVKEFNISGYKDRKEEPALSYEENLALQKVFIQNKIDDMSEKEYAKAKKIGRRLRIFGGIAGTIIALGAVGAGVYEMYKAEEENAERVMRNSCIEKIIDEADRDGNDDVDEAESHGFCVIGLGMSGDYLKENEIIVTADRRIIYKKDQTEVPTDVLRNLVERYNNNKSKRF